MEDIKLHILLIDDDRFQAFSMKKIIEDTGLAGEITLCANGLEAADLLRALALEGETLPDVIFLDINMPVMNAWKFLEAYNRIKRSLYKDIAIYVLTSSTDSVDMGKSRHYDTVKGFIVKPATREKIRQILASVTTAKKSI